MAAGGGKKAVVAALGANLGIALLKFLAYLLTGASAMLAESVHSVADSGNQVLLLVGRKTSRRLPDERHPFGHGSSRYVYGFVVSIVLFSLGGLFALYEAYEKWRHPHAIEGQWWWVPLAVLAGSIILEGRSFLVAVSESKAARGNQSLVRFISTAKAPELPVIMLEDSAAVVGLLLALLGVGMTLLTGNGVWDAVGTGCIGVLLVLVAAVLAVEMTSLLLGESAGKPQLRAIRAALEGEGRNRVLELKTMHLGPEDILVTAKIAVRGCDTAADLVDRIKAARRRIREAVPAASHICIEPDLEGEGARAEPAEGSQAR
jgi:cation diffusion facilitator family transporter